MTANFTTPASGVAWTSGSDSVTDYLSRTNSEAESSGVPSSPTVVASSGLRYFRALKDQCRYGRADVFCIGDSLTYHQGADGVNGTGSNTTDALRGWSGQLRQRYALRFGDPGEGFIFSGTSGFDSRVTQTGSPANFAQYGPNRHSSRLLNGTGQKLTITIPSPAEGWQSPIKRLGVIQANQSGDTVATWTKNGVGQGSVGSALSGDGTYRLDYLSVDPGDVVDVNAPSTTQTYISGFVLATSQTNGLAFHRMGIPGYVVGDALGGQTSGVLSLSSANQTKAIQSIYKWAANPALLIIAFLTNDAFNQSGTGATGGITPAIYGQWVKQVADQFISDTGGSVLLLGNPRNPNALTSPYGESAYIDQLENIATANDHYSVFDVASVWGTATQAAALDLQFSGSVHPNLKGYSRMAASLYSVLESDPSN